MTFAAITGGLVLIIFGALALLLSGWASSGAFLPIIVGALWTVLGLVGEQREERDIERQRLAIYGATLVALVGFFLTFGGLQAFLGWLGGTSVEYPLSIVAQALTSLACLVFVLLELRTFVSEKIQERERAH
ncbi:MAG: hypothetical protein U5L04_02845 [Trueperaceae bacterium]|nr:hypothetical protein [Trueperaceae bacterium]